MKIEKQFLKSLFTTPFHDAPSLWLHAGIFRLHVIKKIYTFVRQKSQAAGVRVSP